MDFDNFYLLFAWNQIKSNDKTHSRTVQSPLTAAHRRTRDVWLEVRLDWFVPLLSSYDVSRKWGDTTSFVDVLSSFWCYPNALKFLLFSFNFTLLISHSFASLLHTCLLRDLTFVICGTGLTVHRLTTSTRWRRMRIYWCVGGLCSTLYAHLSISSAW